MDQKDKKTIELLTKAKEITKPDQAWLRQVLEPASLELKNQGREFTNINQWIDQLGKTLKLKFGIVLSAGATLALILILFNVQVDVRVGKQADAITSDLSQVILLEEEYLSQIEQEDLQMVIEDSNNLHSFDQFYNENDF